MTDNPMSEESIMDELARQVLELRKESDALRAEIADRANVEADLRDQLSRASVRWYDNSHNKMDEWGYSTGWATAKEGDAGYALVSILDRADGKRIARVHGPFQTKAKAGTLKKRFEKLDQVRARSSREGDKITMHVVAISRDDMFGLIPDMVKPCEICKGDHWTRDHPGKTQDADRT